MDRIMKEDRIVIQTKTIRLLALMLGAGLMTLGGCIAHVHHGPVDPHAHKPIRTIQGCKARVHLGTRQRKCMRCVGQKGPHQYVKTARLNQRCQALRRPPPPPPRPMPALVKTARGCNQTLANPGMRARCRSCVTRPARHNFVPKAAPGHRCRRVAMAPPPPRSMPALVKTARGCNQTLANPGMKARCRSCVTRPARHNFVPNAAPGHRCRRVAIAPPPPPPKSMARVIHRRTGCNAKLANPKNRARCNACVTRPQPHRFLPDAAPGQRCRRRAVAPPPPPPPPKPIVRVIHRRAGCNAKLANPKNRARCNACVTRPQPHKFLPDAAPGQRCRRK
jgi:hypothetical protein